MHICVPCPRQRLCTTAFAVGSQQPLLQVKPNDLSLHAGGQRLLLPWNGRCSFQCVQTCRAVRPSAQPISAVATVDQSSSQPLTPSVPSPRQIFDARHVPDVAPAFLLYFPLGRTAYTSAGCFGARTAIQLMVPISAGVLLASIRMALWVVLLAADLPWLTDNNLAIPSMPTYWLAQSTLLETA